MKLNDEEFRVLKELSGGAKLIARISGASYVKKQQKNNVWAVTRSTYSGLKDKGFIEEGKRQSHREATEYKLSKKGYAAFKRNQGG